MEKPARLWPEHVASEEARRLVLGANTAPLTEIIVQCWLIHVWLRPLIVMRCPRERWSILEEAT